MPVLLTLLPQTHALFAMRPLAGTSAKMPSARMTSRPRPVMSPWAPIQTVEMASDPETSEGPLIRALQILLTV